MIYLFGFLSLVTVLFFVLALILIFRITGSIDPSKKLGEVKLTNLSEKYNKTLLKVNQKINENDPDFEMPDQDEQPQMKHMNKLFVLNFKGDIQASKVSSLKEEITTILQVAKPGDEVILNLESPGGVVHGYGLAAAQLARLKKKVKLTITVDKVAASGGYMMAAVADKIVAAPFSIIGSIGVVIEFPNFSTLLERIGVKYQQLTAGKHKRTISAFTPNDEEGIQKTREDLAKVHSLFKDHIKFYRPSLNIEEVSTGETWYGSEAISKGLIDQVSVSDDVILDKMKNFLVFQVEYKIPQSKVKLLSGFSAKTINGIFEYWIEKSFYSDITERK